MYIDLIIQNKVLVAGLTFMIVASISCYWMEK